MQPHSILDLILSKFKYRLIHTRQLRRGSRHAYRIRMVPRLFRYPCHFFQIKAGVACRSSRLDDIHITGNPTPVRYPVPGRARHIVPHTHMGCPDPVFVQEFFPHVKVQVIPGIAAIYEEHAPAVIDSFCRLIYRIRVRGRKYIAAGGRICKPFPDKSREHRLMSAASADDKGHLVFSPLF